MRNKRREEAAIEAAGFLKRKLNLAKPVDTAIVLGTGWGDALELQNERDARLDEIPRFGRLQHIAGHARRVVSGELHGREVLLLRGRVHLNEAPDDSNLAKQVRLQVEMLFHLGVTNLVLTSAVGGLIDSTIYVGDLVVISDFVTSYAPPMPLWAGEFCTPKNALSVDLQKSAKLAANTFPGRLHIGPHGMVRGPQFESLLDKRRLKEDGAIVVGMSTLPEVCVASLYPEVRVLAIGFVTNGMFEPHNHETNVARAKAHTAELGHFLERIVQKL